MPADFTNQHRPAFSSGTVEGAGIPVASLTSDIFPVNSDAMTAQGDPDNPLSILTEAASSEHANVYVIPIPEGANYLDLFALVRGLDDVAVDTNASLNLYGRLRAPFAQRFVPSENFMDLPTVLTGAAGVDWDAAKTEWRWVPLQEVGADDAPVALKAVAQRYIFNSGAEAICTTIPNRIIVAGCDFVVALVGTAMTLTNGGDDADARVLGRFLV